LDVKNKLSVLLLTTDSIVTETLHQELSTGLCVLQAPNLWTPQLLSMTLMAYARNDCVHSPACQALLRALVEEALQQIEQTDCQVRTSSCSLLH
jgi:hypothetical protein